MKNSIRKALYCSLAVGGLSISGIASSRSVSQFPEYETVRLASLKIKPNPVVSGRQYSVQVTGYEGTVVYVVYDAAATIIDRDTVKNNKGVFTAPKAGKYTIKAFPEGFTNAPYTETLTVKPEKEKK